MRKFLVFCLLLLSNVLLFSQTGLIKGEKDYYLANSVVIKLKSAPAASAGGNVTLPQELQKAGARHGVKAAKQNFPPEANRLNKSSGGLEKIITLDYTSGEDPLRVAKKLSRLNSVEWAEPRYVRIAAYDINDPQYNSLTQYNLYKINASAAWDINRGSSSVIIGIIDSGVFWEHPDLMANIHQNLAEDADHDGHTIEWNGTKWVLDPGDLNGIDDDGNGCIDDLVGWDFGGNNGTPDNNPDEDYAFHGTFVAGVAGAVTNNGAGVASIGFNCSILPVKCTRKDLESKYIIYALEGIKYAADNGAKIINCSFAGYVYSKAEQEVITYAVSKGALVVAAAGNDNTNLITYPAGYDGVLAVAATNSTDKMWASSNYGESIDVAAPGQQIYSTWGTEGYSVGNGTSFAAPLAAGLAGLVKSQFPSYTPLQIAEQIRVTSDDISSSNADSLKYKLGRGRINAYRALSTTNAVSLRGENIVIKDEGNNNGVIESGEMASIQMNFVNYLSPVSGVQVKLSTSDSYITIENSTFNTGSLSTLGTVSNSYNKFYFYVKSSCPQNEKVSFLLTYSGSGYDDFQWVTVTVNPSFGVMAGNNIALTITDAGNIGYADYPDNTLGTGFRYKNGENLLYEGSFLYGTSASKLVDAARVDNSSKNNEFFSTAPFVKKSSSLYADQEGTASFNDNLASSNKLGIETKIIGYQYSSSPYNNFIILRTVLSNKTSADINNLYAGWYLDVDLDAADYSDDVVDFDQTDRFAYVYDENQSPNSYYFGAALLTGQTFRSFGIDNSSDNNGLTILPSFTKLTKWNMLSGAVTKTGAGPGDISLLVSAGPMNISANGYKNVSFVLAAGFSLEEIRTSIVNSKVKYASIPDDPAAEQAAVPSEYSISQNFPNPFNSFTKIKYGIPKEDYVKIKVFDILGREVARLEDGIVSAGTHFVLFNGNSFPSGVYFYQIETSTYYCAKKMLLVK